MGTAILRTLAAALLAGAALAGCGDSAPPASTPGCAPACNGGYACVASECVPACAAACTPSQSCVVRGGTAACEGPADDAAPDAPADATTDAPPPPPDQGAPDAPAADAAPGDVANDAPVDGDAATPDAATPDAAMDASIDAAPDAPADAATIDRAVVDVAPPMDTSAVDTAPADARPDTSPTDVAPADVARADAASDASDGGPAPCGTLGLACCTGRVCVGASVCDVAAMRCVGFTAATDECTATVRCPGTQVCGGVYFCDARACLLCVPPGARPLGAACARLDECASGFCANGVCTATCAFGSGGDAQCRASDPRALCAQFTSRPSAADGGVGNLISTFGGCVAGCARNADCAAGLVCRLQRNDLDDRLDNVCGNPTGGIAPGAACDPSPPSGSTAAAFCNNSQCVATGAHTGYCSAFCVLDADCPSSAYACVAFTFGRPSGAPQTIRMCALR